jgi:hypothetical protein
VSALDEARAIVAAATLLATVGYRLRLVKRAALPITHPDFRGALFTSPWLGR